MLDAEHYVAYCLLSVQTTSIPVLTLPPVRDNKATQHILITLKSIHFDHPVRAELTMLSTRISDYPTITQGKTRIPGVNDAEELETLDVSRCSPRVLQLSAPHQGPSGRQLPVQITPQAVRISPHQLRVYKDRDPAVNNQATILTFFPIAGSVSHPRIGQSKCMHFGKIEPLTLETGFCISGGHLKPGSGHRFPYRAVCVSRCVRVMSV